MADLERTGKIETIHIYSGGVFFIIAGEEKRFNISEKHSQYTEQLALLFSAKSVDADVGVFYRYDADKDFNRVTGMKW